MATDPSGLEERPEPIDQDDGLTPEQRQQLIDWIEGRGGPSEPSVVVVGGGFASSFYLNDSYFANDPRGIPTVVCHGRTAGGMVIRAKCSFDLRPA